MYLEIRLALESFIALFANVARLTMHLIGVTAHFITTCGDKVTAGMGTQEYARLMCACIVNAHTFRLEKILVTFFTMIVGFVLVLLLGVACKLVAVIVKGGEERN